MIKTVTNWILGAALLSSLGLSAQVSQYGFSATTGTYQTLDNPISIASVPVDGALDSGVYTQDLPFTFSFNGNDYNSVHVFTDGFLTFGSFVPTGHYAFKPFTSQDAHQAILAAFNDDLIGLNNASQGQINYQVLGTAPNRTFVVEWKNFARYQYTGNYDSDAFKLNFQIRLNENNTIEYVYDVVALGDPSVRFITVGLRGANADDFAVRTTENVTDDSWANTVVGSNISDTIMTDQNNVPASGLTFIFTPPVSVIEHEYCEVSYEDPYSSAEPITYVEFNTIANTTAADFESEFLPHYEDFSSISTQVQKGNTYTLKIKGNTDGDFENTILVYIDWNYDGQFDNSANSIERYYNLPILENSTGEDDIEVTYEITVPETAAEASVRMRIIKIFQDHNGYVPCGIVGDYGQVEDYTLQVVAEIPTVNCVAMSTFNFDFEDITTESLFTDNCWNGNYTSYPTISVTDAVGSQGNIPLPDKAVQIYKGTAITSDIILVTPEVTTTNGTHALSFDIEVALAGAPVSITGEERIQIGTLSDNTDFTTFVPYGDAFMVDQVGSFSTPPISFPEGHKYVALKFELGTQPHKALVIDNVKWEESLNTSSFDYQQVSVYPNPAVSTLFVQGIEDLKQVIVFDISGKQILKTTQTSIDIQNLSKGMYILQVESESGAVSTHKFLKK
ncbi:MAG: T9SS type A sorting domain-containing protein [Bacteroidota bacterium]|nr:T9SS type A sorting domain-containing protein [Bacteroidota bacterium]